MPPLWRWPDGLDVLDVRRPLVQRVRRVHRQGLAAALRRLRRQRCPVSIDRGEVAQMRRSRTQLRAARREADDDARTYIAASKRRYASGGASGRSARTKTHESVTQGWAGVAGGAVRAVRHARLPVPAGRAARALLLPVLAGGRAAAQALPPGR